MVAFIIKALGYELNIISDMLANIATIISAILALKSHKNKSKIALIASYKHRILINTLNDMIGWFTFLIVCEEIMLFTEYLLRLFLHISIWESVMKCFIVLITVGGVMLKVVTVIQLKSKIGNICYEINPMWIIIVEVLYTVTYAYLIVGAYEDIPAYVYDGIVKWEGNNKAQSFIWSLFCILLDIVVYVVEYLLLYYNKHVYIMSKKQYEEIRIVLKSEINKRVSIKIAENDIIDVLKYEGIVLENDEKQWLIIEIEMYDRNIRRERFKEYPVYINGDSIDCLLDGNGDMIDIKN